MPNGHGQRQEDDVAVLAEHHPDLLEGLREVVCDDG